jgi:cyanophycinase
MATKTNGKRKSSLPSGAKGVGKLIIIGGNEDKQNDMRILKHIAEEAGRGIVLVATVASSEPEETWDTYSKIFKELKTRAEHLHIPDRQAALTSKELVQAVKRAAVVFFTGGDQLEISGKIGGTALADVLRQKFLKGGCIAGTSAGAAAMSEMMIVSGAGDVAHSCGNSFAIATGLGYATEIIIDQHFSQRGRITRLVGAVAQNPRLLGIGIDEDTAVLMRDGKLKVMGSGSVYVLDGRGLTATNLNRSQSDTSMSVFDVRLHLLNEDDSFDLKVRRPAELPSAAA